MRKGGFTNANVWSCVCLPRGVRTGKQCSVVRVSFAFVKCMTGDSERAMGKNYWEGCRCIGSGRLVVRRVHRKAEVWELILLKVIRV